MGDMRRDNESPLGPVFQLIASEYRELGVIVTYQIGIGLLALAIPIAVQAIVNSVAFTPLFQPIVFLMLALLACQLIAGVFRVLQLIVVEKVQRRIFTHLAMELAYRLPRMIKSEANRSPEMVNRFFDIITVQKSLALIAIEGTSLFFQLTIGCILLAFYHPMLLAYDIGLILALLVVVFGLGRGALRQSIEHSRWKYNVVGWLEEVATKSIAFSSKSARFFVLQKADDILGSYLNARQGYFRIVLRQVVGLLGLQAIANTALLSLGVWLIMNNQLSIGQLVAAELVVSGMLYSFSRFQKHLSAYYELVAALDKLSIFGDIPLESHGVAMPRSGPQGLTIEAQRLFWQAPVGDSHWGPLSFVLEPGAKVAVHGPSGSGKSLLVDTIFGLKEPNGGHVLINGIDFKNLALESLRERISLIRGVEIVRGTILKNVKLGCPKASIEHITKVLNDVGILKTILSLPQGLDTILEEDGAPLSIGQAKLLILARAIVGNPDLLLIDQTFDGLDPYSKKQALDLVFSESAPWSVLITSQDLEVERRCDKVLQLEPYNSVKEEE